MFFLCNKLPKKYLKVFLRADLQVARQPLADIPTQQSPESLPQRHLLPQRGEQNPLPQHVAGAQPGAHSAAARPLVWLLLLHPVQT